MKSEKWNWNHHLKAVVWTFGSLLYRLYLKSWFDGDGVGFELPLWFVPTSRQKQPTRNDSKCGWLTKAGSFVQAVATKCHLHTSLTSTLYDIDVPGYKVKPNRLRLFDLDSVFIYYWRWYCFDKTQISLAMTSSYCPDDSNRQGIAPYLQQYFMVSNGAQWSSASHRKRSNLHDSTDYAVVQINDTHPSMVIPGWSVFLTEREWLEWMRPISIVRNMTAYTNLVLAKPLKNGHLVLQKWFLTWFNHLEEWTAVFLLDTKIQCSNHRWEWSRTHGTWISTIV